jgi:hypothetical protein
MSFTSRSPYFDYYDTIRQELRIMKRHIMQAVDAFEFS